MIMYDHICNICMTVNKSVSCVVCCKLSCCSMKRLEFHWFMTERSSLMSQWPFVIFAVVAGGTALQLYRFPRWIAQWQKESHRASCGSPFARSDQSGDTRDLLIVFDALTNLPSMASSSAVLFLRSKLYNEIRLACEAWHAFLILHLKLCFLLVASLPGCFVIILLYVYTHCWLLLSQYDDAGSLRANVMFAGWKEEGSSPKWQSGSKVSPGMFGNMQRWAFYDSSLWAWKLSFHLDILLLS